MFLLASIGVDYIVTVDPNSLYMLPSYFMKCHSSTLPGVLTGLPAASARTTLFEWLLSFSKGDTEYFQVSNDLCFISTSKRFI